MLLVGVPLAVVSLVMVRGGRVSDESLDAALNALRRGDAAPARELLDEAEARTADPRQIAMLRGMVALADRRWEEADRHFAQATAEQYRAAALLLRGEALYQAGRHPEAQRSLLAALEVNPELLDARRWLAASYYDLGVMEAALQQLKIISASDPADARASRLHALILRDYDRYPEAVELYAETLQRDSAQPDHEAILLEYAECQFQCHRYAEAAQTLATAQPSVQRSSWQAECAYALGNIDEAENLSSEVLAQDSSNLAMLLLRARLRLDAGDPAAAEQSLKAAVELHPIESEPHYRLAGVYQQQGRAAEAEAELAEMKRVQARWREFSDLNQEATTDPTSADLRRKLGDLALELAKPELARRWYEAALSLDPQLESAREALLRLPQSQPDQEGDSGLTPLRPESPRIR